MDIFGKKLKEAERINRCNQSEIEKLKDQIKNLQSESEKMETEMSRMRELIGPHMDEMTDISTRIDELNSKYDSIKSEISEEESRLAKIKEDYIETDENILMQSFGFYKNRYKYSSSLEYKSKIEEVRTKQKEMIQIGKAAYCTRVYKFDDNARNGQKFVKDNIKQILRTFNIECDEAVGKVKFNNFDMSLKRIEKSFESLNKLNEINRISISKKYLQLKISELTLCFEHARKVQEEKEELRRQRELAREELKAAKEMEEKRASLDKEQSHYEREQARLMSMLENETDEDELRHLQEKLERVDGRLDEIEQAIKDVDYRAANQKAGFVYVISNIGAFGEGVFKIGMTRRLEPQDRIDELSGASVPFRFDVHALIFSKDAPKLEADLHREFENFKVNLVNGRKEFFRVPLSEIERVVKKYHDQTVDFNEIPEAEQYRESLRIRENRYCNGMVSFEEGDDEVLTDSEE